MLRRYKHIAISSLFIAILLVVLLLYYRHAYKGYAPVYPNNIVPNTTEIIPLELEAFIKTTRRYKKEGLTHLGLTELSLVTDSSMSDANPNISRWLERKGWNAERFFHIGSRIRVIISTIKKDKDITNTRQLLLEQAKAEKNSNLSKILLQEAEKQQQSLNIEKITDRERKMISSHMDEIIALFGKVETK